MAKLTEKEFMEKAKLIIGDRTDDDAISFLEDCKDTISSEGDEWKKKYDDLLVEKNNLDTEWRKKYTERFFTDDTNSNNNTDPFDTRTDEQKKAETISVDDLFTKED